MPEINIRNNNTNRTADDNLIMLVKNIARAYREIGVLTEREYNAVQRTNNVDAINDIIGDIPNMETDLRLKFCKSFVANDTENFNNATPAILAYAYMASRNEDTPMARALAARIDEMSADFANSGGMVLEAGTRWPLVDITNIADVYEGFKEALEARIADLDKTRDADKIAQMKANLSQMEMVVADYDRTWGLDKVRPEDASQYERRWDKLNDTLDAGRLTESSKDTVAKYIFRDENGNPVSQFLDDGELDEDGRAAALLNLTRGDIARRHVTDIDAEIDADEIEQELNEEFLFKLYETANADKVVQMAQENPEVFMDPKKRAEFIRGLSEQGGTISNEAYNAALDENANATAGWASRFKKKLGTAAEKVGGFFGRVFHRNKDTDRLSNARMAPATVDLRQKRIELFTRILKGFAAGFIASAIITTIATAAAATAGISLAASMAAIGIITAIGMGVIQVNRWRRAQQAAGAPTDIRAFLADKRLITSLGVSAIAVTAMCFGAAGMGQAAMALGYGALALGGTKNAVDAYRDARSWRGADGKRMSVAESIAWAIANAGAVVAGGLTGRMAANAAINAYNNANPENTLFQNANERTIEHTNTTTETRTEYTQDALDNAEKIARMWYRNNPDVLQQRVDAINAYNAEHGTSIDPYRAIMINGDAGGQTFDNMRLHVNNSHLDPNINDIYSHGHHRVLTDAWGRANGFTDEELNAAAHLFNADGSINANGMDVVSRLDGVVSETNTVGYINGRPVQTDGYFKPNDPKGWTTYTDGRPATVENTYETTETTYDNVTDYTRANGGEPMAAFGNDNLRDGRKTLKDRIGAFWDDVRQKDSHRDEPTPIKPIEPSKDEKDDDVLIPVLDEEPKERPVVEPVLEEEPVKEKTEEVFDDTFVPVLDEKPEDRPVIEPVLEEEPVKEKTEEVFDDTFVPVLDEKPEDRPVIEPVLEEEPEVDFDDVFVQPIDTQDKDELVVVADDKILALTRPQAKSWVDVNARLKKVREKLNKSPHGSKAAKLHAEESKLTYIINELRNKVGHHDDAVIERAAREALLRETLNDKQSLINAGPGDNATKWGVYDWHNEIAKLDKKINKQIEKFGADIESGARADESKLYFPTPVPGVQRQKKDARGDVKLPSRDELYPRVEEVIVEPYEKTTEPESAEHKLPKSERRKLHKQQKEERSAARRAEREKIAASMPQKVERFNLFTALKRAADKVVKNIKPEREYFIPDSLEQLVGDAGLIDAPITDIRGVPVRLVDLGGNNNPITQNRERPIVVVEIRQNVVRDGINDSDLIRIPFYLATGLERNSSLPTGHWYPLSNIYSDGQIWPDNKYYTPELRQIATALDERIGDIRNWRDTELTHQRERSGLAGFVGGADAMQHVNPQKIKDIVYDTVYDSRSLYSYSKNKITIDDAWMASALSHIQSSDWARRRQRIGAGIRNIGRRTLGRIGLGRNDYDDEY